jgi:enoyl-CoA hydratase
MGAPSRHSSRVAARPASRNRRGLLDCINVGGECGIEEGLEYESAQFGLMFATDDMREGTTAFLERRKPVFVGR